MSRIDNNYFTYRQTPATENGTGTIVDIKGKTLVWNQLVQNGNFENTDGWLTFGVTLSVANNIASCTLSSTDVNVSIARENIFNGKDSHIIFATAYFKSPRETKCGFYIGNNRYEQIISANVRTKVSVIGATASSITNPNLYVYINRNGNLQSGDVVTIEDVHVHDLTQMGLDISSPSDFTSLFPLSYYSYNQGSLLSFNGSGLKTGGENLIDFSTLQIGKNWTKGSAVDRAIIEFPVEENKEYTISFDYSSNILNTVIIYRTGWNPNQISNNDIGTSKEYTFTAPSTCKVVCIQFNARVNGFVLSMSDFYGFWNCALTDTFSTKALPVSTYFPTGMKSAGSVYDELTESKAITRIGAVDLGSLTWNYNNGVFETTSNVGKRQVAGNDPTIVCPLYIAKQVGYNASYEGEDKVIWQHPSSSFRVRDSAYTSASAFKTAMSGVYLYYELATPTETDISPELDLTFNIDAGGTEELLPSALLNGSVDLGSLTWTRTVQGGYGRFNAFIESGYSSKPLGAFTNVECALYTVETSLGPVGNNSTNMAMCGFVASDGGLSLYIRNDSYTDANSFKQAMQGVYLWYEKIDSTPTTSPILCDIFYRGMIPVSVVVYPIGAGTVTGAGQYRYGETATLVATPNDIYRFLRYEDENGDTLSTDSTYSFEVGE